MRRSIQNTIATDFSAFEHLRPIRSALVMLVVLSVTCIRHDLRALLPLGIGLLFAAVADRGMSLRRRVVSMMGAAISVTIGAALGSLVSANTTLHVVVGGLATFVYGVIGVTGLTAMTAGVLGLVVFTVFAGSPIELLDWRTNTVLMLLGTVIMIGSAAIEIGIRRIIRGPQPVMGEDQASTLWSRLVSGIRLDDPFVRHGIRLAIVMMIAIALEEILAFPHSYWIPMTVAWISRPDRDGTVDKVTSRVIGTLLGVAIAGLLIGLTPASKAESMLMVALAAYVVLAFLGPNYAVAVSGVTVFVFFLFHVVGYPLNGSIQARTASTVIAAALVLVAVGLGRLRSADPAS